MENTITNENGAAVAVAPKQKSNELQVFEINGNLPQLDQAVEFPVDLMADYWTPENPGEFKNVYFDKIATRVVRELTSESLIELECAIFLESTNGTIKSISNGSKKLVGALLSNNIQKGTALRITYLGKKKNKSNNFSSDNWSIKPLIVNI